MNVLLDNDGNELKPLKQPIDCIKEIDKTIFAVPHKSINFIFIPNKTHNKIYKYIQYGYYKRFRVIIDDTMYEDTIIIASGKDYYINKLQPFKYETMTYQDYINK